MVIYHEMMEAKQSRSQDSQSELDVLCSESDSDGPTNTPKRLKRKKVSRLKKMLIFNRKKSKKKLLIFNRKKYVKVSYLLMYLFFSS